MLEDIEQIELLASIRTNDLSEPVDLYLQVADRLEGSYRYNYITRANFIREHCSGLSGKSLFELDLLTLWGKN